MMEAGGCCAQGCWLLQSPRLVKEHVQVLLAVLVQRARLLQLWQLVLSLVDRQLACALLLVRLRTGLAARKHWGSLRQC